MVSRTHIYVLVNIRSNKLGEAIEYYIVPSKVVAEHMILSETWCQLNIAHAKKYRDKWSCFGAPTE